MQAYTQECIQFEWEQAVNMQRCSIDTADAQK